MDKNNEINNIAKYNFEQERSDYLTPPEFFETIFKYLDKIGVKNNGKFDIDVCTTQCNVPANTHFIEGEKDGLAEKWDGLCYCNPPYKNCDKWVKKAYNEFVCGVTTVLLIPARTETGYWAKYILLDGEVSDPNIHVKFLRKGLCFLNPETHDKMGVFKNALAIVVMNGSNNVCTGRRQA